MFRRTKIICTIGPASDAPEQIDALIAAGMNAARLNFSHGSIPEHRERVKRLKAARERSGKPLALMLDTRGPEVRTGNFRNGGIVLQSGAKLRISEEDVLGSEAVFSLTLKNLAEKIPVGASILINDGLIELQVLKVEGRDLLCEVVTGGPITDHKSVHFPGIDLHLPPITETDREHLRFAVEHHFDWVAASFIQRPEDVLAIRKHLASCGDREIKICAKIENREGMRNFNDILKVADGILVARGDLGVTIPEEEVPITQKKLIREAFLSGLPSITATEMLDSMTRNTRPTRAEVSDVANAILDGTSAVLLSAETASGKYPVESLQMMDRIIRYTESRIDYWRQFNENEGAGGRNLTNAISHAACTTAMDLGAAAIITMTHTGRTARNLSHFRPACPIIAGTASPRVVHQLSISWGVQPVLTPEVSDSDDLFDSAATAARESGIVNEGDLIVSIAGTPAGMAGTTNTLRAETLGSTLLSGKVCCSGEATLIVGDAALLKEHRISDSFRRDSNYILVAEKTSEEDLPLIREARGIIVEDPDPDSHTVRAAKSLGIPLIYGAKDAMRIISDEWMLHLNLKNGMVS